MRLFGLEITRAKAAVPALSHSDMRGWFTVIRESFAGAFQSHIDIDAPQDLTAFGAVYACVSLIAADVGKLRPRLTVKRATSATWMEAAWHAKGDVLLRPNHYQTRMQFFTEWVVRKLLTGNTYVLKERNSAGVVVGLCILDSARVKPLVTPSGDVYYQLSADNLAGVQGSITVPATEIIHDRGATLWHPLVGVSPIYACGASATHGRKIQNGSARFFQNASRPGGMLTAPGDIDDETAIRLKNEFEQNFSGSAVGRLFVGGSGLKYEPMTIPPADAQLIEQLRWTAEDVARCFHVPQFKIGGPAPATNTVEAMNAMYYADCLQGLIEGIEQCLDDGLALDRLTRTEFDLSDLLRMDASAQYEALGKAVGGGWMAPNEARERVNLPPVAGGDTPYLQVQNYSLAALNKRDQGNAAPGTAGDGLAKTIEALVARDALRGRGYDTREMDGGAR